MQQRGIGLAGAVTDIVAGLDEGDGQVGAGQFAGDRRTDDAGADDDDVADLGVVVWSRWVSFGASAAVAAFHRRR